MPTTRKKTQETLPENVNSPETKEMQGTHHPLLGLRQEVDNLFDNFLSNFSLGPFGRTHLEFDPFRRMGSHLGLVDELLPDMDVSETDKEFFVSVELPGMNKDDFDITIENGYLIIKGEKEEKREEEEGSRRISERRYGSVYRSVPLPRNVDEENVDATFEKGVLEIRLPIAAEPEEAAKKITVESR